MRPLLFLGLVLAAGCSQAPAAPDFDAALQAHLDSVQSRDLEAYARTITTGDELPLIFPDGTLVTSRDDILAFHEDWFGNPDWRMGFEPVHMRVGETTAIALMRVSYRDTPDGEDRFNYLTLVFQLEDGAWRLVHDQNTRIAAP
ncbi:nuclear transport factor 2 family protein [uncultured Algimonas sp.]|uniref:YybH family protein n=1 Tax=uncultured Algimonas sp. TaxID=1547920 RepID=UPI0026302EA1|nr:nuclear transport factor 2 family protein [uncultured Algimonas sp.]